MYACSTPTSTSNAVMSVPSVNESAATGIETSFHCRYQVATKKIVSIRCPAIMLAVRRTERVSGRRMKTDTNSIGV